jgi:hypothetical protein
VRSSISIRLSPQILALHMDNLEKPVDRKMALSSCIFMINAILDELTKEYDKERKDNLMQRTLALGAIKKILVDLKEGTL